jgi:hypothetical protein
MNHPIGLNGYDERIGKRAAAPAQTARRVGTPAAIGRFLPLRLTLVLAAVLAAAPAAVPTKAEVASLGLAGAYSLRARGVDAPAWNPATLCWNGSCDLRIFSAQASVRNNSFTRSDYNRWNGASWSESDKREILDRIPGASFEGRFSGAADGPGIALRGLAVTVGNETAGFVRMPREFARLVLYGNNPEESFSLAGAGGAALAWSELRLSYAREVARLHVSSATIAPRGARAPGGAHSGGGIPIALGASIKYLKGWGYGEVVQADGGITTTMDGIEGRAVLVGRTARGGSGLGLDLGAAARMPGGWDVGLSLRNMPASIRWSDRPEQRIEQATADTLTLQSIDQSDDIVTTGTSTRPIAAFSGSIPATLTLGVGRTLGRNYLEADFRQGFSDRAGVSKTPRFALGAARRQWLWLEGRLGVAVGGTDGPVFSAGLGLAVWKLRCDVAASSPGSWNFTSPRGVGGGISLGMRWTGEDLR